jgi:hypothetical protein
MLTQDQYVQMQRQQQEQAAAAERGRKQSIELFTRMFLSLGPSCIPLAESSRHDAELAEAKGLAAWRWNQLLGMEQQIIREEGILAACPKTRPAQQGDDLLPDRTLDQRNADWQVESKNKRAGLEDLKEQAKRERRELESYIKSRR